MYPSINHEYDLIEEERRPKPKVEVRRIGDDVAVTLPNGLLVIVAKNEEGKATFIASPNRIIIDIKSIDDDWRNDPFSSECGTGGYV